MGGLSNARELSLEVGATVLAALSERGYRAVPIYVDRDVDLALRQSEIDVAFIALSGRYGEDGCIQGLLETLGIPYTGADVLASALAMNKAKTKDVLRLHNVPTPPSYVLTARDAKNLVELHGDFGYPAVVKPLGEAASLGVATANNADELARACARASCFDSQVLVERHITGTEVAVAVIGTCALGAAEVVSPRGICDFAAKQRMGDAAYFVPPRLSPERYRGILRQAVRAATAVGASGATQVDLILDESGNEMVIEVNTLPPLLPRAIVPRIAATVGIDYGELCEAILAGARVHSVHRGRSERRLARATTPYPGTDRRESPAVAAPH